MRDGLQTLGYDVDSLEPIPTRKAAATLPVSDATAGALAMLKTLSAPAAGRDRGHPGALLHGGAHRACLLNPAAIADFARLSACAADRTSSRSRSSCARAIQAQRALPEPLLVAGRPAAGELSEPPEHLPADAQAFWRDTVARLVDVGLIDRVDVPMLEQLAVQYARIRAAQKVIAAYGMFTRGSVGQIREHPAVRIEREATRVFLALSRNSASRLWPARASAWPSCTAGR